MLKTSLLTRAVADETSERGGVSPLFFENGLTPKNLPLLVAGGRKLGMKHGQHLAFDTNTTQPLSNVLLTLVQKMGIKTASFRDSKGTLTGLS